MRIVYSVSKTPAHVLLGCDAREKLHQVREWVVAQNFGGLFESGLGNIGTLRTHHELSYPAHMHGTAYVLNLRGDDVPFCPFFYSYLFIGPQQTILFVNSAQLGRGVRYTFQRAP